MRSLRREYLDQLLNKYKKYIKKNVLDVGGKKIEKKGFFSLELSSINYIKYLNPDKKTKPDYLCPAEKIPIKNNTFDTVILTEVLEYVDNVEKTIREIVRITKKNSYIIVSVPFLVPVHGDFHLDKRRYTEENLRKLFLQNNLKIIHFEYMGSVISVIFDLIAITFGYSAEKKNFFLLRILNLTRFIFKFLDSFFSYNAKFITTGYFFILKNSKKK